jgi:hypothetical protein
MSQNYLIEKCLKKLIVKTPQPVKTSSLCLSNFYGLKIPQQISVFYVLLKFTEFNDEIKCKYLYLKKSLLLIITIYINNFIIYLLICENN